MIYTESLKASRQTAKVVPPSEETFHLLGSGLVIFKGRKTGYAGGTSEVSPCVPCFIFPKVSWNVSNRSFPVLMVFLVSMTDARSVIIYVIKPGLQWKAPPDEYGPHKMLYNRSVSWSKLGVFNKIFTELTNQTPFDCSPPQDSPPGDKSAQKGILHVSSIEQKEA